MDQFFEGFFKKNPTYIPSPHQMEVLKQLESSAVFLSQSSWKKLWAPFSFKGVYLHGAPGGGKTVIMNYFFETIHERNKKMDHFHTFLFGFHQEIQSMSGVKDPFSTLIHQFSKDFRVLCLDEFFIDNIADAMILERFLKECVKNNIFVFLTSNIIPGDLYKNGLHRDRFLSCIEFISQQFLILELDSHEDYRKYESWEESTIGMRISYQNLCEKPFGVREYLLMSEKFETLEIYDFPLLDLNHLDSLKRLMVCTDIFYLEKKRLKINAQDLEQIEKMETALDGMARMASRLKSMMGKSNA